VKGQFYCRGGLKIMSNYFKDVPVYEWDDLDGKTVIIRVSEDNSKEDKKCKVLSAYDPIDNITYVLATEFGE
jgi:hypothetical protein